MLKSIPDLMNSLYTGGTTVQMVLEHHEQIFVVANQNLL